MFMFAKKWRGVITISTIRYFESELQLVKYAKNEVKREKKKDKQYCSAPYGYCAWEVGTSQPRFLKGFTEKVGS